MGYITSSTVAVVIACLGVWRGPEAALRMHELADRSFSMGADVRNNGAYVDDIAEEIAQPPKTPQRTKVFSWRAVALKVVFFLIGGVLLLLCGWASSTQPKRSFRYGRVARARRSAAEASKRRHQQLDIFREPPASKEADTPAAETEDDTLSVARITSDMEELFMVGCLSQEQSQAPEEAPCDRKEGAINAEVQHRLPPKALQRLAMAGLTPDTAGLEVPALLEDTQSMAPPTAATVAVETTRTAAAQSKDAEILRRRLMALPTPARRRAKASSSGN